MATLLQFVKLRLLTERHLALEQEIMDPRVTEFHCIMPMANVPSVLTHGVLSYDRASKLEHHSVAMSEIQERRDQKQIPGGLRLHQYANLYFHARNPMLYKRLEQVHSLCVLRVSIDALKIPNVVLTDSNASSDYVRFLAPHQWNLLPFDDIYSMDWRHPDRITYFRQRSRKCAEVLVPNVVPPALLLGAYVISSDAAANLAGKGFNLPVQVNPGMFFRSEA